MMETETGIFAIGKYRIIGTLGRGAMGVVYKAQDPEIGRIVAVKVLRSLESESEKKLQAALEQFKIEARSAGNLRHPHIITVFEVSSQDASPYIVMDYIEGQGLDQVLAREGALVPDRALPILRQIAEGLDHAHERNVVHRDIKPSNILIDARDNAFIVDFGVATIGRSRNQNGGSIVGSPGYMSPEQILAKKLDHLSDLFSFAILSFEVLSGVRPFDGDTFNKVVSQILNNPPRSISDLRPAFPLEIEVIFERALSKRPSARYPSATEFISELERVFSRSRPESRGARPESQGVQRKPSLWGPLDVKGAILKASDTNLPAVRAAIEGNSQIFSGADAGEEWKRPALRESTRTKSGAHHTPQEQPCKPWSSNAYVAKPQRHGVTGVSDEIAPKVSFGRNEGRSINRILVAIIAIGLIVSGILLCWTFFISHQPPPKAMEVVAVEEHGDTEVRVEVPAVTVPLLPEALEAGRFDPASLAHTVESMGDRELLGVLVQGDFPIDDILKALVIAKQRNITGRYEAAVYLLGNDSYVVRVEAIKYLADSDERRFVPAILTTLEDRDPLVRIAGANALRGLGDRKVIAYLTARMKSEELPEVKGALRRAIEKLNGFPLSSNF